MDASEVQGAKRLSDENARLRKLVADLSLDKEALQSVIERTAGARHDEGRRRAYPPEVFADRAPRLQVAAGPVSSFRYRPRRNDATLRERLVKLAREKPRFGYRRLAILLSDDSRSTTSACIGCIARPASCRVARKRKHCVRVCTPLGQYTAANQEWALDFVHDVTALGRSIRVLNLIDGYTREMLAMEVDTSFAGLRVTRVLDQIIA